MIQRKAVVNMKELLDMLNQSLRMKKEKRMNQLESNKTLYIGNFIIRLTESGVLKVTSDRGVINIQPKADNAVEIKSSKS